LFAECASLELGFGFEPELVLTLLMTPYNNKQSAAVCVVGLEEVTVMRNISILNDQTSRLGVLFLIGFLSTSTLFLMQTFTLNIGARFGIQSRFLIPPK
jgi:hypothetical protein